MTGRAARTALRHDGGVCAMAVDIDRFVVRLLAYRERYLRARFAELQCRSPRDEMDPHWNHRCVRMHARVLQFAARRFRAVDKCCHTRPRGRCRADCVCALGRHHSSDLQSKPDAHRVRNQGRTTLWNRQRFCKVARILSQ